MIPVHQLQSPNNVHFQKDLNIVFGQINKWYNANFLSLNFNITFFIRFINKSTSTSTSTSDIQTMYEDKFLQLLKQKFHGLFINNTLFWKTHVEYIKSKLSLACYPLRQSNPMYH